MDNRDITILIQSQLKSVIENYPAKTLWTQEDEVEILKRVGVALKIYKHYFNKRRSNDKSQNTNRQPNY